MGRIFWQFFLAIWLTIISAIAVISVANVYLNVLPPRGEMREAKARFAFHAAGDMIRDGRVEAAGTFLETIASASKPTRLTIERLELPERSCLERTERFAQIWDRAKGGCYGLSVSDDPLSFLETWAPPFLPPLAALAASLVSALLLARYLVRPVETLRTALGALAAGDFTIRIGSRFRFWRDEITALGKDFDVAAGKLQELEESQKRLFHDVSHELRSPLSRLQAAFGLLRQNSGKLEGLLPRMEREVERLDELVEEILTLARLGSGRSPVTDKQPVDIIDLLGSVTEDAVFEAAPRGIMIDHAPSESFVVAVDGELIYRAIENVMRNAVKYSHDGSVITVRAGRAADAALTIIISNVGSHVPASEIERLFEPFSRHGEHGNVGGHGLGLAIARRAVELHGGTVCATSNKPGGMIVTLTIPAA